MFFFLFGFVLLQGKTCVLERGYMAVQQSDAKFVEPESGFLEFAEFGTGSSFGFFVVVVVVVVVL
jgi:hypothetical protein